MKYKVYKLFVNYEKEEKWLNEMAAKGMHLVDYSIGRYLFEEGQPGEYVYRIELLENMPSNAESRAYIKFMEDSGIECVASYFRWVYFRKKASEGAFDLYSDYDSRIKHYKKVSLLVGVVWTMNLIVALYNSLIGFLLHDQVLYLNLYLSLLNWFIVIVFTRMLISYLKKVRILKREKLLYE